MQIPNERRYDVVGMGGSTLDRFTVVKEFPTGREVQEAVSMISDGGGPVSTALAVVGRFGGKALMLDRLGDDDVTQTILDDFKTYNVSTDGILRVPGAHAGCAIILVKESTGERAIFFTRTTAPELTAEDLKTCTLSQTTTATGTASTLANADASTTFTLADAIRNAKIFHCNGRHSVALPAAIAIAKEAGTLVSFDGGANRYSPTQRKWAESADIAIVAKEFADRYTEADDGTLAADPLEAARRLHAKGVSLAGVTVGAKGSYLILPDGEEIFCPPFQRDHVVDTTGCGDSYHGAFLYALCAGYEPKEAIKLASAVGALNTRAVGGRRGLPTRLEAELLSQAIRPAQKNGSGD